MKLDDAPILERKRQRERTIKNQLEMSIAAGPLVMEQFEPFEKYIGKPEWCVGTEGLHLMLIYPAKTAGGNRICFSANLRFPVAGRAAVSSSKLMVYLDGNSPEGIAEAFVACLTTIAEEAFEAIVLDETWRLERILRLT